MRLFFALLPLTCENVSRSRCTAFAGTYSEAEKSLDFLRPVASCIPIVLGTSPPTVLEYEV